MYSNNANMHLVFIESHSDNENENSCSSIEKHNRHHVATKLD
ncbi:27483_t:CDS:1, partial [Racocetra persica]